MPEQQPIAIPFTRGIDTKTDAKLVSPPYLAACENGVFTLGGAVSKRNGFAELPTLTTSGSAITKGAGLAAFGNELLLFDDTNLYSYGQASAAWVNKGAAVSVGVSATDVIRNAYQQTMADSAVANNIAVYAWLDSRGGVRASVVDTLSGVYYQADVALNATASQPRCVVIGASLFVLYVDSVGRICFCRLGTGTPATFDAEKVLVTDANFSNLAWDVAPLNSSAALVAYQNAAGTISVFYLLSGGYLGVATNGYYDPITITGGTAALANCLAITTDGVSKFYIGWHNGTNGQCAVGYNTNFTVAWAVKTGLDAASPALRNLTAVVIGSSLQWFSETSGTPTVRTLTLNAPDGTTTSAAAQFKPAVGLGTKAFVYNGQAYVTLAYTSSLQSAYFLISASGAIVAKHLTPGLAGGLTAASGLPQVNALPGAGAFSWAGHKKGKLNSQNGNVFSLLGVTSIGLQFQLPGRYASVTMGGNLHVVGGMLQAYDSSAITEHGFYLFPEGVSVSGTAVSGGTMSNGSYLYQCAYEWVDNQGQVHRSSPSVSLAVTLSGGGSAQSVTLSIPTLQLTNKMNVVIGVYRTQDRGTIFYKVSSTTSPIVNNTAVGALTFTDTLSDAAIASNEILYTVGGELPNDQAPSAALICATKSRVLLAGTEDPNVLWFSKEHVYGQGLGFSAALTMRISPTGGPITAIAVMDDKVIVFKRTSMLFFSGDGPNALGQGGAFTEPQIIASDVGCINPRSLVLTSEGLFFVSGKGIYRLNRALQCAYVGAPVEAYNAQTATGAVLVDGFNQVRFAFSSGSALVYNYFFEYPFEDEPLIAGQWSTFTNHEAAASCLWQNAYTFLRSNGVVRVENNGFVDGAAPIALRIQTAWVKLASIQGLQRVFEAVVLGNYKSPHQLQVNVAYDYQTFATQTLYFQTNTALNTSTWGSDATWGAGPWGGTGDTVYQFRNRLPVQQCEAVQFEFKDIAVGAPGEGYSLNTLTLLLGAQPGLARLASGKTL